ncbi:hypothetical protein ACJMK2_011177 [Sinanodonta woodiana]|uniref:Uncharacterized protein n=1 Tax=Sinanodonta woodiana TaxID=1069815 RepID=A0ABD3V417_SINWO
MDQDARFQARQTTLNTTDTFSPECLLDHTFQENIMHPLQMLCRQLNNIVAELLRWEKQHYSLNKECKNTDRQCSTHHIKYHTLCEPQLDGSDSLKLPVKLAEETEPKLPYTNSGSTDVHLQLFNGSVDQTECKGLYSHHQSLRENPSHVAQVTNIKKEVKFPHCDQMPRNRTGPDLHNESISQIQKTEDEKSGLDDRYCLSKAIKKNLTLLLDVLPYRESELPDLLGEACLTDNENNLIRGTGQREDQIRLLLRTIMGRSFCDIKKFLDYAREFNPDEVDKVWKTYDDLKREGNIEKRCIICLVMAYVDIKYVADVMYEKELIPDSLYGRASNCKGSFGCQNRLWKELCRIFQHCNCKDTLVETLINALEKKSKYRYLGEELRKCDRQVFATLKCKCKKNQRIRKKVLQRTMQTKHVRSRRADPRCSSSGTTSSSAFTSYTDSSLGWNLAKTRRPSCLRREEFARFYKRRRSFHKSKRQTRNTETTTKSFCNSSSGMSERYTSLNSRETSNISSLPSSRDEKIQKDISASQLQSKKTLFQDSVTTTHCNNSWICKGESLKNGDQAVFHHDVMYFRDQQKDVSDGGDMNMTSEHRGSGEIQSNKTMSASTTDTLTFRNTLSVPTSNREECKHCQASEIFFSANQYGERNESEIKTHTETEEAEVSDGINKETYTVINDCESRLFDTERNFVIAKAENKSDEMSLTLVEQTRLQSKRSSLTRGLAIESTERKMKHDSVTMT